MKTLVLVSMVLLSSIRCSGQEEFAIYPNGLMYSEPTMQQLKVIVDSLNLKFKSCDLHKTYYSKAQAKGHFIFLEKGDIAQAKADLESNISLQKFLAKYPKTKVTKDLLIVKHIYTDYDNKEVVEFSTVPLDGGYGLKISGKPELFNKQVKRNWIFEQLKSDKYTKEAIRAFYLTSGFEAAPMPELYARMVQYSDCMVDTTAQIFREDARKSGARFREKSATKVDAFMKYIHRETGRPEYDNKAQNDETAYQEYWGKYRLWDSLRLEKIERSLAGTDKFQSLLKAAAAEAMEKGGSDEEFEEYVSRYLSKKAALELKRGRTVVGGCSMDDSPRQHALSIAVLSAETTNWETFLRAHLDIMNDRFERVTDGSYAWERRKTYIRELEELDINVPDLMLGISLRVENPSQNHYYGSIGRLGRALSETKSQEEIKAKLLSMIKDRQLDDYNRIVAYYLFRNYNSYIEDKTIQKANNRQLGEAVKELPEYLALQIKID